MIPRPWIAARLSVVAVVCALLPSAAWASLPSVSDVARIGDELRSAPLLAADIEREQPESCAGPFCAERVQAKTRVRGFELGLHCRVGGEDGLSCTPRRAYGFEYGERAVERSVFTGHYFDTETKLYFANARYFDPEYGRFTSQDSFLGKLDNPPSLHRYFYANDNPTRYIDPTGHISEEAQRWRDDIDRRYRAAQSDEERHKIFVEAVGTPLAPLSSKPGASPEKSWTRNFIEEAAIELPIAFLPMDTFEGLAQQDPVKIAKGLGLSVAMAVGGVIIKEVGPAVIEKLVEKVPAFGKEVGTVARQVVESTSTLVREKVLPRFNPRNYELPHYSADPQVIIGGGKGILPKYVGQQGSISNTGGIGPVNKGRIGAAKSQAEAIAQGEKVRGPEVTFELPSGRRTRSDFLTETQQQELKIREAKEGPGAKLTDPQRQMQSAVQQGQPVIPRGKNAEKAGLQPGQPVVIKHFEEDRY